MIDIEKLKKAKTHVKDTLKHVDVIVGVGIGDNCINVYLKDNSLPIPEGVYLGEVPINFIVTGEIHVYSG